jgi:NADH:ubiquinone oxidoreductase subunit 2 (subunit N)
MYMHEPEGEAEPVALVRSRLSSGVLFLAAALILLFGIVPGILFGFLEKASVLKW